MGFGDKKHQNTRNKYGCGSKRKTPRDHRFWSIFPFTYRVFKAPFFDPLPYVGCGFLCLLVQVTILIYKKTRPPNKKTDDMLRLDIQKTKTPQRGQQTKTFLSNPTGLKRPRFPKKKKTQANMHSAPKRPKHCQNHQDILSKPLNNLSNPFNELSKTTKQTIKTTFENSGQKLTKKP